MQLYNMDSNWETLESSLVERIRLCWKGNRRGEYERNNLKDAISELRTFRDNRAINPVLHARLDKEACLTYKGSGFLGYNESNWELFCRNKHILTRTPIDEPTQESLFEGIPAPAERAKGRENPPKERITKEYYTRAREDIDNGTLTPYLPVRDMCSFIIETDEQTAFLHSVRLLAADRRDDPDHSRDYKRIYRLANRVLTELHEQQQQGTLW